MQFFPIILPVTISLSHFQYDLTTEKCKQLERRSKKFRAKTRAIKEEMASESAEVKSGQEGSTPIIKKNEDPGSDEIAKLTRKKQKLTKNNRDVGQMKISSVELEPEHANLHLITSQQSGEQSSKEGIPRATSSVEEQNQIGIEVLDQIGETRKGEAKDRTGLNVRLAECPGNHMMTRTQIISLEAAKSQYDTAEESEEYVTDIAISPDNCRELSTNIANSDTLI